MKELSSETLHASCVAIRGRAVMIEGRSGSGKSDLALRLIDRGAVLVADDQLLVQRHGATLLASAPDRIAGRMEARGLGIVELPFAARVPLVLAIAAADAAPRLANPARVRRVAGIDLPALPLALLEASAAIKVEWALARMAAA